MMKRAARIFLCLALGSAALLLYWPADHADDDARQPPSDLPQANGLDLVDSAFPFSVKEARFASASLEASSGSELMPGEVIDRQDVGCYLKTGESAAEDLAIVGIRTPDGGLLGGTRFSVLDSSGAIHSGALPFLSYQAGLGRTRFGQVVSGFGGVRANPESFGLHHEGEPMKVYMDDRIIYERDQVWFFDIASDGSSFFFIEPLGNDYSSRLVIVNLEQGTETHHDLGTIFAHPDKDISYLASYTPSNAEVHLKPVSGRFSEGLGTHYFFDARRGGSGRALRIPDGGRNDIAHFTSSEEGYWLMEAADDSDHLQVVKYLVDWNTRKAVPVLNLAGPAGARASSVHTSMDGARLLFKTATASTVARPPQTSDSALFLLDAATGEAQFILSTEDASIQRRALSNVLPASPTEDDIGRYNSAYFLGNTSLVIRRYPRVGGMIDQSRNLYDVYDLKSISLDAQPRYRAEGNWHWGNDCASRSFPGSLFATAEGRLAYARRSP